jgi:hypothetical protein
MSLSKNETANPLLTKSAVGLAGLGDVQGMGQEMGGDQRFVRACVTVVQFCTELKA